MPSARARTVITDEDPVRISKSKELATKMVAIAYFWRGDGSSRGSRVVSSATAWRMHVPLRLKFVTAGHRFLLILMSWKMSDRSRRRQPSRR